jgi:WD repeat-containing protein 61
LPGNLLKAHHHHPSLFSAHSDAIWGVSWTEKDTAISISADGSIKQWLAASGQPHPPNAAFPTPHTLAQVSLSVSLDGKKALYNSIEGHTSLWNLENGEVATFESYAMKMGPDSEACRF